MSEKLPKVLLLETQLDHELDSYRSQARYMREFFTNLPNLEFISKEVHSRADLAKFLEMARDDGTVRVVHLIAHGFPAEDHSRIVLTHDETIDLSEGKNLRLFRDLNADALVLSCCGIGANAQLMQRLVKASGVEAAFSYTGDVEDYQAFVLEPLIYHLAYGTFRGAASQLVWFEVYERLLFATEILGIDGPKTTMVEPLLAASFRTSAPAGRTSPARS